MPHYLLQYDTRQGQYTHNIELNFLQHSFMGMPENSLFLDISGGGGRMAFLLAKMCFRVVVTDIVLPSLSYILSQSKEGIQAVLVAPSISRLPFRKNSFDGACCLQVPDLVENDKSFFSEIGKILKPHAPLVVTLTNRNSYKSTLRHLLGRGEGINSLSELAQTRVYRFSIVEIVNRALDAGFIVREMMGYNWIPFPKSADSKLIFITAILERWLMLRRLTCISPWVLVCLEKVSDAKYDF